MEVLAHVSVCQREGEAKYVDEAFGLVDVAEATPKWAVDRACDYYMPQSPHLTWTDADRREIHRWMKAALKFGGGRYDPRQLHVLDIEKRFDFEIDEPWAKYRYELPDGSVLEGNLGLKGTIDLITQDKNDPRILEVIDWKTGKRKDWSKEGWDLKTYKEIRWDPQLCLYHYACTKLYPDVEEIFFTINYVNSGGPYSLCFEKSDIAYTEQLLKKKFIEIKNTTVPELKIGRKCTTFCYFGTNRSPHDPNKTICQFFKDKVRTDGIDNTTKEFGRPNAFQEYGEGGGRREQRD